MVLRLLLRSENKFQKNLGHTRLIKERNGQTKYELPTNQHIDQYLAARANGVIYFILAKVSNQITQC